MECSTLETYTENGTKVTKPKKQFKTLDAAIAVAKIENARPERFNKVVAYKCKTCFMYHIGRNGKEISHKEKTKLMQEMKIETDIKEAKERNRFNQIKVVGFIDLKKIKYW